MAKKKKKKSDENLDLKKRIRDKKFFHIRNKTKKCNELEIQKILYGFELH